MDGAWGLGVCEDFLVFDAELDMDGVADSIEESVGGYVALGSDNTVLDLYAVSP